MNKEHLSIQPIVINGIAGIAQHIGITIGPGEWLTVTQEMINAFAQATFDFQWVHTDVEKAGRLLPGGKTIAHGYLTLSLIPQFLYQLVSVENVQAFINYGIHSARFISPVQAGGRIRLQAVFTNVEELPNNHVKLFMNCTLELDGSAKPACVAELISIVM
jgi:NADPH2:quinone reductase